LTDLKLKLGSFSKTCPFRQASLAGFFTKVVLDEQSPGYNQGAGDFGGEVQLLVTHKQPNAEDQQDKYQAEKIVEGLGKELFHWETSCFSVSSCQFQVPGKGDEGELLFTAV
jgi:hypothetical protein